MSRLQNGWIKAKPTAWGLSGDDPNKDPQFAVTFEIVEGEDTGKTITWYTSPSKSAEALEYTDKALRKMGWTGTNLASVELSDEPVSILIEIDNYEGKDRQKVKAIGSGNGGGFKPLDQGRQAAFAAKMEQRIQALSAKNGGASAKPAANGTKPATRPSPAPQNGDDDIPF